jgi:hypothetical protein
MGADGVSRVISRKLGASTLDEVAEVPSETASEAA